MPQPPSSTKPARPRRLSLARLVTCVVVEQDERRQKRLARNRESARQSRRRKKEHLELLEEKVRCPLFSIRHLRKKHDLIHA